MATEFKLPELGENIESGTIVKVSISKGDTIAVDQTVMEVETDKAVLEIPSDIAGVVTDVRVKEGQKVKVGQVIFVADAAEGAPKKEAKQDRPLAPKEEKKPEKPKPVPEPPKAQAKEAPKEPKAAAAETATGPQPVLSSPSVRRLARELGVDLNAVAASTGGRVTVEDVRAFAEGGGVAAESAIEAPAPATAAEGPGEMDSDNWGPIAWKPMSGIRRKTALHMTQAWTTIPHVTQFDTADITDLERFREQYGRVVERAGGKLTMSVILVKALAFALRKFPQFNASVDMEGEAILYKGYVNIGMAVDTDNGLLVPVIRDADTKSLAEIAVEVAELAKRARERKLSLDDMRGGTFTVTNLGGIGGTAFTPIINAPEVAILGVSRSRVEPVWRDGEFVARTILPLSLSYDHRVIDGADAARFTRWLANALEQPLSMFLE